MKDFATSDDPRVQAQLDRLSKLSLPQGRLGLETIRELLARLGGRLLSVTAVPIEGSDSHGADAYGPEAKWAESVEQALRELPGDGAPVLIAGSLYLAGKVLAANGEIPD